MAADVLVPIRLAAAPGQASVQWALGKRFSLPAALLHATGLTRHVDSAGNLSVPAGRLLPGAPALEDLRLRAAYTEQQPRFARLPFSYQVVPPALRMLLASLLGRWRRRQIERWAAFPGWPLDLSADFACDLLQPPDAYVEPGPAPVLLTHDLDSPEGLARLVRQFLPLEEAVGARSVNFIVPCAWKIDDGLLTELKDRGHEIGTHGYDHSNRTAFLPPEQRQRRLREGKQRLARYEPAGYRAPSLLRTAPLLRDLARLYRFDSSIPTSGGLFPVPNNGCASARPFVVEGIVEIPLSLPRDGSLRFLGHSAAEIAGIWIDCAEQIAHSGGVVVLLTHCEARFSGNAAMLDAYRRFLEHLAGSSRFCWSSPAALLEAAWPGRFNRQMPEV